MVNNTKEMSSPTSSLTRTTDYDCMSHRHDDESVEVVMMREPGSPTSTGNMVFLEDPTRASKVSYQIIALSYSEGTKVAGDDLVGLQYAGDELKGLQFLDEEE